MNVVAPGQDGALHIRTFERGVEGETLSCGTGVVASALSDMAKSGVQGPSSRTVHARGGVLHVEAQLRADGRFDHVWLWGAARRVFQGTWLWMAACLCTLGMACRRRCMRKMKGCPSLKRCLLRPSFRC